MINEYFQYSLISLYISYVNFLTKKFLEKKIISFTILENLKRRNNDVRLTEIKD